MFVQRRIHAARIARYSWKALLLFAFWALAIVWLYQAVPSARPFMAIPYAPLSTIGIAVSFYLGFKNSQSYDRFWEGRKIWGGIVNASRSWANQVLSYVSAANASERIELELVEAAQRRLVYRHLAWVNALRLNQRRPSSFSRTYSDVVQMRMLDSPGEHDFQKEVKPLLPDGEFESVAGASNVPTQIVRRQTADLKELFEGSRLIEDFHMEMMRVLEELTALQGKCERIKGTPFPRQYAYFGSIFTWIFVYLLPLGLLRLFAEASHPAGLWMTIPCSVLVSWIFFTMEEVGSSSEDPFEGFANDVPMSAISRTIEIDLREMLGESDLPPRIAPVNGILS